MIRRNHVIRRLITGERAYPEKWTKPYFVEDIQSLSAKAAHSTIWSFSQKVGANGISLVTSALIARVLFPVDFGLVGMAALTLGVVSLFRDLGFGAYIVYKKSADQIDLSTIFWLNLAISIILYALCFGAGPLANKYFNNEKVEQILRITALTFIIGGIGSVHNTILVKQLRFKAIAYVGFFSSLINCFVTLLSVMVFRVGYWGIIFGMLSSSIAVTGFNYYFTRWYPLLVFDFQRLREMFHYGKNLFFQRILNYFASNIDYFIIGRMLGAASLGIYRFAYVVPHTIYTDFSQTLSAILFPVLCKVTDEPERFKKGYLKAIKFISFLSFPAMTGLFSVADHFITAVFSERYIGAVIPLKILCFSGMSRSILTTMGPVFNSKGRPDIELKWNLCVFPVIIIVVYFGSSYGLNGVALAMTLTSYFCFIAAWISMRLAKIKFSSYLAALLPAFIGSILVLASVMLVNTYILSKFHFNHVLSLIILIPVGACIYVFYLFLFFRSDVFEFINFIKGGISR